MTETVALIVQPMTDDPHRSGQYADEALIAATLAVLATLEERGWTILLHSDPTVAVASALSGLERRPAVPMEREPDRAGGASIVYIPIALGTDEAGEKMLRDPIADRQTGAEEGDLTIGLVDILLGAGLLRSEVVDLRTALREYRPAAILAIGRRSDWDELENAMEIAEAYATEAGALLFTSTRSGGRDRWRGLEEMLTTEQREMRMLPLPGEQTDVRRDDDARIAIERDAMEVARISLSAERAILHLLHELD